MKSIQRNSLAGARVLVIGLGRSGRATLEVLQQRGAVLFVTDESPHALETVGDELRTLGVSVLAADRLAPLASELDLAVLSPGVPLTSRIVRTLQKAGIAIVSEIEMAYRISQAPIIAITGTKGKSTTTTLTGALLRSAGHETYVGGNIGNALIVETAMASPKAWVVAEVSSFQLETIDTFKPRLATILNLSPDHLDRYRSMEEYIAAKYRVFANQTQDDIFVGNLDDPILARLCDKNARSLQSQALCFALEAHPQASLYVAHERILWRPSLVAAELVEIMPIDEIQLFGRHNVANVLASLLLCLAIDCDPERLRVGVRGFRALAHRLELVAEIAGVRYINDAKGTNPGAVMAALTAMKAPLILIAGGKGKGTDFSEMGQAIAQYARAVVLIGEAADAIAATIPGMMIRRAGSMEDAVECATELAHSGDVVLLSPGCASFDMFHSAEERGAAFCLAVKNHDRMLR